MTSIKSRRHSDRALHLLTRGRTERESESGRESGIVRGSLDRIVTRSLLAQFWAPPELTNTAFGHPPLLLANLALTSTIHCHSTAQLAVPGRTY